MTIYLSSSNHSSAHGKSVSTGFEPKIMTSLNDVAKLWQQEALSSAIYSSMYRFYNGKIVRDHRRRIHNVSFIGNTFVYDFDDGHISMAEFCDAYNGDFNFLAIKSINDHKYAHDRFKVMIVHDTIFVQNTTSDNVPDGFSKDIVGNYKSKYIGLAESLGFWDFADHSTTDQSRLCAKVGKEYVVC